MVNVGGVATTYVVRATDNDNTNIFGFAILNVLKVEIKAEDGTGNPRDYVDADTEVNSSYNTVSYNAVVTPSVSGAFSWSTTSSKITLTDASSQVVTVNAGANASASVGAEELKVQFTPSGSATTCDDTHNLTVVHCTLDAFADKTVLSEYEIGHGWWKLAIEPNAATTLIQPMNCRIWVTEAGYFPIITGCPYSDGIVKMGFPTGHSVTGSHEWDIPFIKLVAAAIYCRNLEASPGTYWVFGHNCCAETISVGGEATVTIQGGTPSALDTYLNGL